MLPVENESNGVKITILNYILNKKYSCKRDCWSSDDCSIKKKCSISQNKGTLIGTEVTVNILNASDSSFSIRSGSWEMIDSNGYAYGACALCDTHHPSRTVNPDSWSVSPGTQIKTTLLFAELESGIDVAAFLFSQNSFLLKFEVNPLPDTVKSLFVVREEVSIKQALEHDYELRSLHSEVNRLKKNVFSRFNNTLTPKEITSLDNSIINSEFAIKEAFRKLEDWKKALLEEDFIEAITQYQTKIDIFRENENKSKILSQKVEQLYELTPREFEEWTANLFESLRYEKVTLTPQSNDKGIDVLAEKNGLKIAVQCKKFKGVVGSPSIQTFLGALQNAEAHKGFFITTGTFSVEAEKIALNMPIELYDKVRLVQLIEEAMK
ncbi:restriction endonuclease [Desulfitobacterium sp. Sab5]|uniref:restriction endonuclease n=1 Tax=Desulfitobacterium nosdiversum TaxID=3375356 RepID=UPI003CF6B157